MQEAAKSDKIKLTIISGTRTFYQQKAIWERKWHRLNNLKPKERAVEILNYSSMPCTSRHHWGTDIDINKLNNGYFESGNGLKIYQWLQENASKYGFQQVYTSKDSGRTGYNEEKWHWSYLPVANQYLDFYKHNVQYADIKGFKGASIAPTIKVIEKYVNGINTK